MSEEMAILLTLTFYPWQKTRIWPNWMRRDELDKRKEEQRSNLELMAALQLPAVTTLLTECEGAVCTYLTTRASVWQNALFPRYWAYPLICQPPQKEKARKGDRGWKKKERTPLFETVKELGRCQYKHQCVVHLCWFLFIYLFVRAHENGLKAIK